MNHSGMEMGGRKLLGTRSGDHLVLNRDDPNDMDHSSAGLNGKAGHDLLEASVPYAGQVHMRGGLGNDTLTFDLTNEAFHQGHHGYGGTGNDVFRFVDVGEAKETVVGRIDDLDLSRDEIWIEDVRIDLSDLPARIVTGSGEVHHVRVVRYQSESAREAGLGEQQWLSIDDQAFYALEGARLSTNGTLDRSGNPAEESHFVGARDIELLKQEETVEFVDPLNFVPHEHYEGKRLSFKEGTGQATVEGTEGDDYLYHEKSNIDGHYSGTQVTHAKGGDDVVQGNTGEDTIYGGTGDDLIAGGVDDDDLFGEDGDDSIWGGDGDDDIFGGDGNDYIHGGSGSDRFHVGSGHDVIADFDFFEDVLVIDPRVDRGDISFDVDGDGNVLMHLGEDAGVTLLTDGGEGGQPIEDDAGPLPIVSDDEASDHDGHEGREDDHESDERDPGDVTVAAGLIEAAMLPLLAVVGLG